MSFYRAAVGQRRSISFRISSAQRTASAIALIVAGTRLPPSNCANLRAARIAAAISRTRLRPSSTRGSVSASPIVRRCGNLRLGVDARRSRPPRGAGSNVHSFLPGRHASVIFTQMNNYQKCESHKAFLYPLVTAVRSTPGKGDKK